MISVIIPTWNAAKSLPRCFESLIPGVISGVVREVIVADGGSSDATLAIADAAGARVVSAERSRGSCLAAGASIARGDWLLFLHPETALQAGWEIEAQAFVERGSLDRPLVATFRYAIDGFGGHVRWREFLARSRATIFGLPYGDEGLLIPKRLYVTVGGYTSASMEDVDLIRRVGRGRLVILRSLAINGVTDDQNTRPGAFLAALHAARLPRGLLSTSLRGATRRRARS